MFTKEYFPGINEITYKGPATEDHLAFRYYDENYVVGDKTMKEHFRFAMAYWHSMCNAGSDPFGSGTRIFPWDVSDKPMENAKARLEAAFEFMTKMSIPFYCFHDRDIAPEGKSIKESENNLKEIVDLAGQYQEKTGVKLLWGTARYSSFFKKFYSTCFTLL